MQTRIAFAAIIATLITTSCGGADSPPLVAPGDDMKNHSAQPAATQPPPAPTQVRISKEIQQACDLSEAETYFAFDSTRIRTTGHLALKKTADCFVDGALAGRKMRLVGHADPPGDQEYNMALGGRRSDAVAAALIDRSLKQAQISTTSRGEMDATGTNQATWAKDRGVDIRLAD
jgi:peptidoglycan-associated lipoprotein